VTEPYPPCVLCGDPILPEVDSAEHLINRAIGGRLKIKGVLCRECNSNSGGAWDAELAEQLSFLSVFFGIKPQKKDPPSVVVRTTAGEELIYRPDGSFRPRKTKQSVTPTEGGVQISLTAGSIDELRRQLNGYKRRYPNIDVEAALKTAITSRSPPQGAVLSTWEFGGRKAGRSIVKSAVTAVRAAGVSTTKCDRALSYLRDEEAIAPFSFYDKEDLVVGRPKGVPIHCVAVSGDPVSGMLLGYVEYFGFRRMILCLSQTYDGPPVEYVYGIDPTTATVVGITVKFPAFSSEDIQEMYDGREQSSEKMREALDAVMSTGMARDLTLAMRNAVSDAVDFSFANGGTNQPGILAIDDVPKFCNLAMQRMMPFLMRHTRNRPLSAPGMNDRETNRSEDKNVEPEED
jgi:hypothetical protein